MIDPRIIMDVIDNAQKKAADTAAERRAKAALGAQNATVDNVSVTEDVYLPESGFEVNDFLIPKKPTTNADSWFEPYKDEAGVSYAGGLSLPNEKQAIDIMQVLSANNALRGESPTASASGAEENMDLSNIEPQRKRRSLMEQAIARGIDLFDMISGADKDAYLGKTLSKEIEYEKRLAEEDPEGYQADINRAKLLSQRAYASEDIGFKKKCGAAIKKLLPYETQGLDDLAAAGLFTADGKMEIEKLKAANRLNVQQLKGEQALAQLGIKGNNAITLAEKQGEIKQALQDSAKLADYQRAAYVADRAADSKVDAARIGAEAKNYATDIGYKKAVDVANINAKSKIDVANINAINRQQLAQLKADAKASAAGSTEAGDIIPSQGVIDAISLIEENPGQFDETANLLDTKVGRFLGLLSDRAINNRSAATMSLQETVTGSVMNLMKLFPKGGASVINSGTEQKRFAPIAEIIANGRGKQIVPAIKAYYGGLYDAAQKAAGERAPISREEYVNLMVYGNTKGKSGGGLSMIPRTTMGMTIEGLPTINKQGTSEMGPEQQSQYKKEGRRVF